jgi:hypothetical protein
MAITKFQPEVWSAAILVALRNSLIYGGLVNRDYEGNIANAGDTVHIVDFGSPAVRSYTKNSDISWDLLTDAERTLVIDQGDYFAFTVDDIDRRQALGGFVAQATSDAGHALAEEVDNFLAALLVAGVDGGTNDLGAVTADLSNRDYYDKVLLPMRTKLNRAKVPMSGRWVVMPPEHTAHLLSDPRFIDASQAADGGMAIKEGAIGRIAGFDVMESNNVPQTTPSSGVYRVVSGHRSAATYADAISQTEALRLQDQFGDGIRGLHLYGAKVVRATCLSLADVTLQA